jgi:hypothetical protein
MANVRFLFHIAERDRRRSAPVGSLKSEIISTGCKFCTKSA